MKHCLYSRLSVLQDNKGENSRRQVLKFKVSDMVVTREYSNEEEMLSLWQITQLMWLKNVSHCMFLGGRHIPTSVPDCWGMGDLIKLHRLSNLRKPGKNIVQGQVDQIWAILYAQWIYLKNPLEMTLKWRLWKIFPKINKVSSILPIEPKALTVIFSELLVYQKLVLSLVTSQAENEKVLNIYMLKIGKKSTMNSDFHSWQSLNENKIHICILNSTHSESINMFMMRGISQKVNSASIY